MIERAKKTTLPVHREIARRPNYGRTYVTSKNSVVSCQFVDHPGNILRMDGRFVGVTGCEVIQTFACFAIVFHRIAQVLLIFVLLQLWKQGSQSGLRISNEAKV